MAGNQVNQRTGNKEGVDSARAAFEYGFPGGFDAGQAADARADVHADTVFVEVFRVVQAGIADGLQRGGDAVVDEYVHAAGFFAADVLADVEIAHFAGDLAVDVGCVETGDEADAAFAGQQVIPSGLYVVADRGNLSKAGDDYSSLTHSLLAVKRDSEAGTRLRGGLFRAAVNEKRPLCAGKPARRGRNRAKAVLNLGERSRSRWPIER